MSDFKPADQLVSTEDDTQYHPAAYPVPPETPRGGVVSFLSSNELEGR